ncbi:MAG: hypothetical protein ACI4V3_09280 [Faecousia sp.]
MKGEEYMKTFETPYVDVKKFDVMDVLTTSGVTPTSSSEEEETLPSMWVQPCIS